MPPPPRSPRSPSLGGSPEPTASASSSRDVASDQLLAESDDESDDDMPLERTRSDRRADDRTPSLCVAAGAVVPAYCIWLQLSRSWESRLVQLLQEMCENADAFWAERPIVLDDGLAAFKHSRNRWHKDIVGMRDSNRAFFNAEITGEATDPALIAGSVALTVSAVYLLLFLPDASIFVPFETRERTAVRVLFNSVNYVRWSLVVLVCWQVAIVSRVLQTAMSLAVSLESNVKKLHMLDDQMLQNAALDPDEYDLKAHTHENRRWGVKVFGFTIDQLFWNELRWLMLVMSIVLAAVFYRLWGYIQDERKLLNKREKSMLEKLVGRETAERMQREDDERTEAREENEHLKGELARTKSQVSRISTNIPLASLEFGEEIGRGSYGVVWKGKWRRLDVASKYRHPHHNLILRDCSESLRRDHSEGS